MRSKERSDVVGIFVAEKWVNSVVIVERHNERVMILKVVLYNGLLTVLTAYAPHSGKPEEEKENFWNKLFSLASSIIMAALCNRAGHYIFALWFLSSFFYFFLA